MKLLLSIITVAVVALLIAAGALYQLQLHEQIKADSAAAEHVRAIARLATTVAALTPREPPAPFEFKYVGKEKYSNEFAAYRFDRRTGKVTRFSYIVLPGDTSTGEPQHEQVESVDMETGAGTVETPTTSGLYLDWKLKQDLAKAAESRNSGVHQP